MASRLSLGLLCSALVLVSVSCGGGGSGAKLRVLQASPSQSNVDVLVDGKSAATDVGYGAATTYISESSGSHHLQIEPTGSSTPFIDETISLDSSSQTTFIVANITPNVVALPFTDQSTAPTSGNIAIRVINAAPSLATVDVYVVPTGADISSIAPTVSGLAFEGATTYQSLVAATYQVYFTIPGTKFVLVNTGAINLSSGQVRTVVGLEASGGGYTSLTLADLG